mgnify:FL=1
MDILWGLKLLRDQYPTFGGLENTLFLSNGTSLCRADKKRNAYVVHSGGNHWISVYTECTWNYVEVYDSLNDCVPDDTKRQIYGVVSSDKKIVMMKMQKQMHGNDCGLFSMATLVDLVYNNRPSNTRYDQSLMRIHYANCIDNEFIYPFPTVENHDDIEQRYDISVVI